jgi:phage gpG-like protein
VPPRVRRPTAGGIGLGTRGGLTAAQLTYLEFEPTIGVTVARMAALANELGDLKEPLTDAVRKVIIPSIQKNFAVGGRPPWEPWSQETIEFKAMMGETLGPSILIRSGSLRGAMGSISNWKITDGFAILDDIPGDVWYGKLHQAGHGGKGGAASLPARPFVMFQKEDEEAILEIFVEWLGDKIDLVWPGGIG